MNAAPHVTFAAIVGTVFLILMSVSTIVGTILFFAGRPRSGVRRAGGSMMLVCGGILTMGFIAGLLLLGVRSVSQTHVRAEVNQRMRELGERLHQEHHPLPPHPPVPAHLTPVPPDRPHGPLQAEAETNIDAGLKRLPEAESTAPADALKPLPGPDSTGSAVQSTVKPPVWTEHALIKREDIWQKVIQSKYYSTIEEARSELAGKTKDELAKDFSATYFASSQFVQDLPMTDLRLWAVRQEYVESSDHDFGSFTAPMHRVWWQIELSPEVRTKLRALWKEQTQDQRTWTVAGALGGITVLLAGLSLLMRRRHAVMG